MGCSRQLLMSKRSPVLIFLSDGECGVSDATVRSVCRAAIDNGWVFVALQNTLRPTLHSKPLSFHTVSFGPDNQALRRMTQVAKEVEATAPRDPLLPPHVESSYATALDSVRFNHGHSQAKANLEQVRLAETFLGLANSLRKTRGSLIRWSRL